MRAEWESEGEQLDRIVGLHHVKMACVALGMPDSETWIELVKFHSPSDIWRNLQVMLRSWSRGQYFRVSREG